MGWTGWKGLKLGAVLAGLAAIVAIANDGTQLRDRWRSGSMVEDPPPEPIPSREDLEQKEPVPPLPPTPTDLPLEARLAEDLGSRLVAACREALSVPVLSDTATPATETSHGMPGQFYQATVDVARASAPVRFDVVGTGRGPAAAADAYENLLSAAIEGLAAAAPNCLE